MPPKKIFRELYIHNKIRLKAICRSLSDASVLMSVSTPTLAKAVKNGTKIRGWSITTTCPAHLDPARPKPSTYAEIVKDAYKRGQMEKWEMQESLANSKYNQYYREDRYNV